MRLRTQARNDHPSVPLTPLIDCVFLLIVFFLVTSMFKRWEMIVPLRLPDFTSSLSETAEDQSILLGMGRDGAFMLGSREMKGTEPVVAYSRINDLNEFLQGLAQERGMEVDLVLLIDRDVPMQQLIRVVDEIKLTGFQNVTVQTRERRP